MNAISIITKVSFDKVCHTGISTWWTNIIKNKINIGECRVPATKVGKQKYSGGEVITPTVGDYKNQPTCVLDV